MIGRIGRWFRRQRDWMAIEDHLRVILVERTADNAELQGIRAMLEDALDRVVAERQDLSIEIHRLQEDLDSAGRVTSAHQKAAEEREQEIARLERRIAALEGLLTSKDRRMSELADARSPAFAPWARAEEGED